MKIFVMTNEAGSFGSSPTKNYGIQFRSSRTTCPMSGARPGNASSVISCRPAMYCSATTGSRCQMERRNKWRHRSSPDTASLSALVLPRSIGVGTPWHQRSQSRRTIQWLSRLARTCLGATSGLYDSAHGPFDDALYRLKGCGAGDASNCI